MTPSIGQIWRDRNQPGERFIRIEHVGAGRRNIHVRTVIKDDERWIDKPRSKLAYCDESRFTGKAGGYAFHEAADQDHAG